MKSSVLFLIVAVLTAMSAPLPQFVEIAQHAGLTDVFRCGGDSVKKYIIETLGGGVALLDYDNDGYLDAFFVTGSTLEGFSRGAEPSNQLYRNNRNGNFTKVTRESGLEQSGWGQGVCAGDYDNDGWTDLFVTYWGRNHLYRNTGKGTFQDVTDAAGLKQGTRWGTGCAFLDYDRDGLLDLFVANYLVFDQEKIPLPGQSPNCRWKGQPVMCGPRGLPGETNVLFRNEGHGKFRDVSLQSGIASVKERYSMSVTPFDFNNDGWVDIYVAVDSQASILYRNNRNGTFTDVGVTAGVSYKDDGREQAGMGSAAGDFDGDGRLDLVKTNFIEDTANLYRNNGDGTFEDWVDVAGMNNTRHMGWGVGFIDYDNDGWQDIFMVNGHVYPEIESLMASAPYRQTKLLYVNRGGKKAEDISESAGSAVSARHSSRGLAFGDFDNDGDVDIFVNNMNEAPSLLRNDGGNRKNFISIRLAGVGSNRSGIGARVKVTAGGRSQVQEVHSGSTFMSQSDLRLHFGLGEARVAETIEIQWPSAWVTQTLSQVPANQFVVVTEGGGLSEQVSYPVQ